MRSVSVAFKVTGRQRTVVLLAGKHLTSAIDETAEKFLREVCNTFPNHDEDGLWIWSKAVKRFDVEAFHHQLKPFWLALFDQGIIANGWTKQPLVEVYSHGFDQTEDWVWRIECVHVLPSRLVITQESLYESNPIG